MSGEGKPGNINSSKENNEPKQKQQERTMHFEQKFCVQIQALLSGTCLYMFDLRCYNEINQRGI